MGFSTGKKLLVTKRNMRSGSGALSTWGTNLYGNKTVQRQDNSTTATKDRVRTEEMRNGKTEVQDFSRTIPGLFIFQGLNFLPVLNPITVYSYGFLFNCTTVGQASDSMTALT